ncbi:SMI1/KNR4 family protein [Burkholderia glumae]|uniref:SMI1/KNR4 family protein n=1 Tax=Burkholderia glumae TaxID=337 RepID=UPI002150C2C4|nr:SMI1/KNR4 family protein [Burkholderia glumae]
MKFEDTSKPLSDEEIRDFEKKARVKLPEAFKRHYITYNGGYPVDAEAVEGIEHTFPLHGFFPLTHGSLTIESVKKIWRKTSALPMPSHSPMTKGAISSTFQRPKPILALSFRSLLKRAIDFWLLKALRISWKVCGRYSRSSGGIQKAAFMARLRQKSAKAFYERVGFEASPVDPMLLLVTLADLEHAL